MNAFPLSLLYKDHRKFTTESYHFFLRHCINFAFSEREMPCFTIQILMSSVFSVELFPNAEDVFINCHPNSLSVFLPLYISGVIVGKGQLSRHLTITLMPCETHKLTMVHMESQLRKKLADWHCSKGLHFHRHGDFSERRWDSITCIQNNNNTQKTQQLHTMALT